MQVVTQEARQAEIAKYDEAYRDPRYNMKPWRQEILADWLEKYPPSSYLDVGCGRGESLAIATALGYVAVGAEVVEKLCDVHRVVHILGAHKLPFQDLAFSSVSCLDVLEHVLEGDVPAVLSEISRVAVYGILLGISRKPGPLHITIKPEEWWMEQVRANMRGDVSMAYVEETPNFKQPYTWVEVIR